jgi:hypothetical protein
MNKQASILRQDLAAKTDEVTRINNEILALNDQIKNNNDSVDVAALEEKIRSITETRNNLLRQQGDAIIATLQEVFKDMVAGFKDVRQSILQQMADLAGGKYPRVLAGMNEKDARRDLNQYMRTGNDPQEILNRVGSLKDAIMAHYQEEYDRLVRLQEQQNRVKTREINAEYREKIRDEQKDLRQLIREINKRYNDEIRQIEKAKTARQREADREIRAIEKRAQKEEERLNKQLDKHMERLQKRNRAEEEVLQKQIQNIQALKSALDQIKEFAKSLKTGNLSALSPEDKIKAAQKEYDDLLKRAKGGDADAAGKLSGASQTLLELLKSYFGSNPQYAAIFTKMQKELEALGNSKIGPTEESVQKKLDKLMDQNKKEEEKLRKTFEQKIDQVRNQADKDARIVQRQADVAIKKMDRQITVLENTRDRLLRKAENTTDRIIRKLETSRDKEIDALTNPNKNEAIKDLKQKTIGKLQHLAEIVAAQEKKARDQMGTLIDETRALNVLNVAQLQQLNKLGQYYGIDPTPVPKFASGGKHKGGWMIAGENGPELMYAPASTVLNAKDTKEAFQSDPKVVEKLEQIKKELEAIVRGNSAADPAIIAELKTLNDRMENIERLNRLAA